MTSLLPDLNGFADSVVLGLVCKLSSPESRYGSIVNQLPLGNVAPVGIQNGFHRHIHSVIKIVGREEGHNATRENAESVACVHTLSLKQVAFNRKFIVIVVDSDVESLKSVASSKLPRCSGMSLNASRGDHVRARTGVSQIHNQPQI